MPFLAECILCHQKVRVPDRSTGASVQCPRCGSYFTAAADNDLFPAAKASAAAVQSGEPPIAASAQPPGIDGKSKRPFEPLAARLRAAPSELPAPFDGRLRRQWKRPEIDPIGAAALLTGGVALLCGSVAWLTVAVLPLAMLGALLGLAGAVVGLTRPKPRYLLATVGGVLSFAILVAAIVFPALLGPTYRLGRERSTPEPVTPRAVALPGTAATAEAANAEWVDAGRFALQLGKVRVQVVSATLRPLEIAPAPKKKLTKASYLVVRVRVHRPGGGAEFAAPGWGEAGTANERPAPTLTDSTGKVCAAPSPNVGGEATELTQKSAIFPLGITDEVYLFDAPTPGFDGLRLEIPAATWSGAGALRFTIPAAMVRKE